MNIPLDLGWATVVTGIVVLVLVVALVWIIRSARKTPREISKSHRPLFWATFRAIQRDLMVAQWASFPPALQRHDARVYAAGYVIVRDLYLGDTKGLNRVEREIVAVAVSLSNFCYYCTYNHAALLQASELPALAKNLTFRNLAAIEDPRHALLTQLAIRGKQPKELAAYTAQLTTEELTDIAATMFTFHYINRIVDVIGPQSGLTHELFSKPPPIAIAGILGLKRAWEPGQGLAALGSTSEMVHLSMAEQDEEQAKRWTQERPDRLAALTFAWSAIKQAAEELFDEEVLVAIRSHLSRWDGRELTFTRDWFQEEKLELKNKENQEFVKLGILVARCAYRVSPDTMLEACNGNRQKRLALVAFAAGAAALRINEWLSVHINAETQPASTPTLSQ